ncbi:FAD binding domain-containing protein [Xylariomycetidae sp. FL2044]|nr:FAD binding domain-containing protein [Xylariomycetidae sp. FL2044]
MAEEQVDVLICGGSSAGLCAGIWLARCGINFKILERRPGPLNQGQADGVQCRTVEIFESFGISENLLKEAYHVLEVVFWSPDGKGGIERTNRVADMEAGLSHQPHVILNQARINGLMTDEIRRSGGEENIVYGCEVKNVEVDSTMALDPDAYCVTVTASRGGKDQVFRAKYALAADGAHSLVRKSLGISMIGDSSDAVWGVMDIYPQTDFPDIRKKATINSGAGNLIIIPREGDHLARFYMELRGTAARDVTLAHLHEKARQIFRPYRMDFAATSWWSAYAIGQRLADRFHHLHRVFLAGDACHTHSPKAGQGMNVSLQDGYNLGWKLAAVLRGRAAPALLLETYVAERQRTAAELIEFDRYWTKLFSTAWRHDHGITPDEFHRQFVRAGRYTAGQAICYGPSLITAPARRDSAAAASLAAKLTVGMRFPSAQVVRLCDARAMQLVRVLPADSRWHIVVFAGDITDAKTASRLDKLSGSLKNVIREFTPAESDFDAILNPILVLSGARVHVEQHQIPEVFTPTTGKWKMKDLLKVFVDDEGYNDAGHGHAYDFYGVDAEKGVLVVVRPDQYIAKICALEDVRSVEAFFGKFMTKASGSVKALGM